MIVKKSLQELYNRIEKEIEEMRQSILRGSGSNTDEITESEKIELSQKSCKEFRKLVFQELGKQ